MAARVRKKKASFVSWRKLFRLDKIAGKIGAVGQSGMALCCKDLTVDKTVPLFLGHVTNCRFVGLNVATARQAVRQVLSTLRFLHPAIAAGTGVRIAPVITAFTWRSAAFATARLLHRTRGGGRHRHRRRRGPRLG
jgi:hypothetical protein